jgi:hypothetical protein
MKLIHLTIAASCLTSAATAAADLDARIAYYSRVVTAEGVTRESRFEETMLRRANHVWTARVLASGAAHDDHAHDKPRISKAVVRETSVHKHFNPVVLPRHLTLEGKALRLEYVDTHAKEVIAVPQGEFDNVSFDGSWDRAYYLLDPKRLQAMPLSARKSAVAGARWRERERDGVYERVLWDERKEIPLVIESGDKAGTFFNRLELTVRPQLTGEPPWQKLKGYARREYADFLD